jgi:hypothetical protein
MIQTLEALFDGTKLHPDVPLNLVAGTRVRIVVERVLPPVEVESVMPPVEAPPQSFLQTAKALNLPGEPDWSETYK